jgi:hypothetical protein
MEELTEVITTAAFHPAQCNLFMYASSKAAIRVGDLRVGAVCDSGAGGGGVRRECCFCGCLLSLFGFPTYPNFLVLADSPPFALAHTHTHRLRRPAGPGDDVVLLRDHQQHLGRAV